MKPRIYIGYDPREAIAYHVCIASLIRHSGTGFEVYPVNYRLVGPMYTRPTTRRNGVLWDEISNAPMSTEFSIARFLVPSLARRGAALYVDCDFMFRAPVQDLFDLFDSRYAVQVVKHAVDHGNGVKMDGQVQMSYARKNWSSLMLFNCDDHSPVIQEALANTLPGLSLHQFTWVPDEYIGGLPREWNHLVGVYPDDAEPKAAHFTLGVPSMKGYENVGGRLAAEWREYAERR